MPGTPVFPGRRRCRARLAFGFLRRCPGIFRPWSRRERIAISLGCRAAIPASCPRAPGEAEQPWCGAEREHLGHRATRRSDGRNSGLPRVFSVFFPRFFLRVRRTRAVRGRFIKNRDPVPQIFLYFGCASGARKHLSGVVFLFGNILPGVPEGGKNASRLGRCGQKAEDSARRKAAVPGPSQRVTISW